MSDIDSRQVSWEEMVQTLPLALAGADLAPAALISGVRLDSRQVQPGDIFVALAGLGVDGHRFIPDAVQRGAVLIVGEQPLAGLPAAYLRTDDARWALAELAASFYGRPARKMTVIGVTGTDGKTTTCNIIYHILQAAGIRAGMISTVSAQIGAQALDTGFHVTTPEAPDVQRFLAEMVQAGLTHAVLEATSHGLAQKRVQGCEFDLAVVTNITHEHLDYHGDFEAYRRAKARLFEMLHETPAKPGIAQRAAVLNRDDGSYSFLKKAAQPGVRQITYGFHSESLLRAGQVIFTAQGSRFSALTPGERLDIETPFHGEYNVANTLAALAATVLALGISPAETLGGIRRMPGVPGRFERLEMGQDFLAVVDFAHTPNALRSVLQTARQIVSPQRGRVIAVFGSAGLRDRQKRRLMAEEAARLADISLLTAEDPRNERVVDILSEMAAGAVSRGGVEGRSFYRIPDRREALRQAVRMARPGDCLLALGKGHEQSMCFGEVEYPWDDRIALRAALAEHLGVKGPQMPYLPD
jgi:UDP-N-acetylmuramoyl-L-alanyl-D-glutamate--2,6-diaminopimelate ligase